MSFGLTGAPGIFQDAMNTLLSPCLRKFVLAFFDDLLVYSSSLDEHLQHLRCVFEFLNQGQWKLKMSKCSFAQTKIAYLGHIISSDGVETEGPKTVTRGGEWEP